MGRDNNISVVLGVDPGVKGAVAAIKAKDLSIEFLKPLPTNSHGIDFHNMAEMLKRFKRRRAIVYCESYIYTPNLKATFNVGGVYAAVYASVAKMPVLVPPASWQRWALYNIPVSLSSEVDHKKQTKRRSISLANALYPDLELDDDQDGLADAIGIALYGLHETEYLSDIWWEINEL